MGKPETGIVRTTEVLSEQEQERKLSFNADIEGGFLRAAKGMRGIRDERLYRDECSTFEEYTLIRFGFSKGHTNNLIAAANTKDRLTAICSQSRPSLTSTVSGIASEGQLRQLNAVPDDKLEEVVEVAAKHAGDSGKKVSAKLLKQARQEVMGEEPEPVAKPKADKKASVRPEIVPVEDDAVRYAKRCVASIEAAMREADAYMSIRKPKNYKAFDDALGIMWEIARGWA